MLTWEMTVIDGDGVVDDCEQHSACGEKWQYVIYGSDEDENTLTVGWKLVDVDGKPNYRARDLGPRGPVKSLATAKALCEAWEQAVVTTA